MSQAKPQSTSAERKPPLYEVGQTVLVCDRNGRGGPKTGTVVKVGRKLVTVDWEYYSDQFRIETGRINAHFGNQWIKTLEQAAEDDRRAALVAELREGGLDIRYGVQLSTEVLEGLAAVLRSSNV